MAKYSVLAILASLWIASIFYVTASSIECDKTGINCTNEYGYAVAVGVVSLVLSMVLLGLELMIKLPEKVHMVSSIFFLVWWIPGCAVGTFKGPFVVANNGYFAAWFALIVSTYYLFLCVEFMRDSVQKIDRALACLGVLFITSVFYLIAAAIVCDNPSSTTSFLLTGSTATSCTSYMGYAVAVGTIALVISMGLIGLYIVAEQHFMGALGKGIVGFLTLWWLLGVSIATFKSPFNISLSNGYFAGWFAFLACIYLLAILFPKVSDKINAAVHPESTHTEMEKQQQSELASTPAPAV